MSQQEPTEFLNDRYTAMEQRLAVRKSPERGQKSKRLVFFLGSTVVFLFFLQPPLVLPRSHSLCPLRIHLQTDRAQASQPSADAGRKGE